MRQFLTILALIGSGSIVHAQRGGFAEVRVVDDSTGRGVPLVELVTVNNVRFVTDNLGRIAIPDLLDREIHFSVHGHGYEVKKDGFGFAGVRITPRIGQPAEVKVTRKNVAERLARLTGEGRFRDSRLLGHEVPAENNGLVAGQDSIQAAIYRGEVYWFWGDTNRLAYPLGLYRMAGAKSPIPTVKTDFSHGFAYDYFVGKNGFARAMIPLKERPQGVAWIDGICTVRDDKGVEKLVGHYSRRKGLADELEHGFCIFNDDKQIFEPAKELPLTEKWRFIQGHPVPFTENGTAWLLCGGPGLNIRVRAALADVLDPAKYEAFVAPSWQKGQPPRDSKHEADLVKSGKLKAEETRFYPANAANPAERIVLHNGSVHWNEHRKRWIMLACQFGGKVSFLGEIWYAEAKHPTGPFEKAVKVVTHDRKTFYNVCHHPFLDREGGRVIHFEGTYTAEFSGNPDKTPRYDYNQVLYRLDLESAELKAAWVR